MRALKLTFQGETAFFKKPDVNTFLYFTYGNIHKVALLGLLGAVMGLKGYSAQKTEEVYPEFYEQLKDLKVAIVPQSKTEGDLPGIFGKKVQTFNNSTGFASSEAGGNLIVKEQWLEKPCWEIYIQSGHPCYEELCERLLNRNYVYIPYLGKNDHPATITVQGEAELESVHTPQKISSLCVKQDFKAVEEEEEDDFFEDTETYYKYEEKLPIALEPEQNQYQTAYIILNNQKLCPIGDAPIYKTTKEEYLYFI